MIQIRNLVLCLGWGLAMSAAWAEPPGKTVSETSTAAKQAYEEALKELGARGAKAKAAAEAGDAAKWSPINAEYAQQLSTVVAICERNVVGLTHDATDVERSDAKAIVQACTKYAEAAGSMETARLQMLSFGHLVGRLPLQDRATILKALAAKYFIGKS